MSTPVRRRHWLPRALRGQVHEVSTPSRGAVTATAAFDHQATYRYILTRAWDTTQPPLVFIMLNPSTATATTTDPTISRCMRRAATMGAGGIVVVNAFALRATDPDQLSAYAREHRDPVGPANDRFIAAALAIPGARIIAAWSTHPYLPTSGRLGEVWKLIDQAGVSLECLGVTVTGAPWHPLYVPAARQLQQYPPGQNATTAELMSLLTDLGWAPKRAPGRPRLVTATLARLPQLLSTQLPDLTPAQLQDLAHGVVARARARGWGAA